MIRLLFLHDHLLLFVASEILGSVILCLRIFHSNPSEALRYLRNSKIGMSNAKFSTRNIRRVSFRAFSLSPSQSLSPFEARTLSFFFSAWLPSHLNSGSRAAQRRAARVHLVVPHERAQKMRGPRDCPLAEDHLPPLLVDMFPMYRLLLTMGPLFLPLDVFFQKRSPIRAGGIKPTFSVATPR